LKVLMNRPDSRLFFISGIIVLVIVLQARSAPAGSAFETISMGVVSTKPKPRIDEQSDFVHYLAGKLFPSAHIKGNVAVVSTALELAKLLNERKVDFYVESPYPTYIINKQTGARVLLRRWKDGASDYRGVLFTTKDSGVTRLDDLLGRIVAFEDSGSTSAYFLPKIFLLRKGFRLTEKRSFEASVSPTEIGYLFAGGSEKKLLSWVLQRNTAAGALSNIDLDKLDEKTKAAVVALAETEMFPRHFLSVRKDLDASVVKRLKEILLSMHEDPEGQKALKKSDNTTKFDLLPGGEEIIRRKFRQLFD
jgi:phosphonate transport system substrate-binding protein